MVLVGGIGDTLGVIIGTLLLSLVPEFFGFATGQTIFGIGILMILVTLFAPRGLGGLIDDVTQRVRTGAMQTDAPPMLELHSISKTFGGLTALKEVSLTVVRGEICGVIGPNGAGKSTLFSVIAGSVMPSAGRVLYAGRDVTNVPMHRRARMGLARTFQLAHTFESMTVEENILIGAEIIRISMSLAR